MDGQGSFPRPGREECAGEGVVEAPLIGVLDVGARFLVGYPLWLALLGPYSAVIGTGRFDFLPQVVRDIPFYPVVPVYCVPRLRSSYDDYLHWWYRDPNEADPETGWY